MLHFIRSISSAINVQLFHERLTQGLAVLLPGIAVRFVEPHLPETEAGAATGPEEPPLQLRAHHQDREEDLSDRDRAILELVRPHVAQAYRNALAFAELRRTQTDLERAIEAGSIGVVFLDRDGAIRSMTDRAREMLESAAETRRLLEWSEAQARPGLRPAASGAETEVPSSGVAARFVLGGPGQDHLVLLRRVGGIDPASALEALGLTRREAEVLALVSRGGSNREVAAELGVRPSTVKKHLEHVYDKLGVHTRTAAVARARGALTGP